MSKKNIENTLKNTATLAKFEGLIGEIQRHKVRIDTLERLNKMQSEQIEGLKALCNDLKEKNKELRKELKVEKSLSSKKIDMDVFLHSLTKAVEVMKIGEEESTSKGFKKIVDTLIQEIDSCIELVQEKSIRYENGQRELD